MKLILTQAEMIKRIEHIVYNYLFSEFWFIRQANYNHKLSMAFHQMILENHKIKIINSDGKE